MRLLTGVIARILYAGPFFGFGVLHFLGADRLQDRVPPFMPAPVMWVYFTGMCFMLAAVAIIADKKAGRLAALLLAAMLGVFILLVHLPQALHGDEYGPPVLPGLLKDLALLGAALGFAGSAKS